MVKSFLNSSTEGPARVPYDGDEPCDEPSSLGRPKPTPSAHPQQHDTRFAGLAPRHNLNPPPIHPPHHTTRTLEDEGDPGEGEGEEGLDAEEVGGVDQLEHHLVVQLVDELHVLFFGGEGVAGD